MAVVKILSKALRTVVKGVALVGLSAFALSGSATAQQYGTNQYGNTQGVASAIQGVATGNTRTVLGERYIPNIWVDPDGCEHWVMDDGAEGYMTPHTNRQGIPVCRRGNVCGVMNSDQFFRTDSARISSDGKARLSEFFKTTGAVSYIIVGHTDSRASDQYNMRLSFNRANSVAAGWNPVPPATGLPTISNSWFTSWAEAEAPAKRGKIRIGAPAYSAA